MKVTHPQTDAGKIATRLFTAQCYHSCVDTMLSGFCSSKHQTTRQRLQISQQEAASSITRASFPTVIFLLSSDWSDPPLSRRMKDIFTENNTRVGPLVYRLQTRGGGRKRVNGQKKKEKKRKEKSSICVSFPASFSFISLTVSSGCDRCEFISVKK